MNGLDEARFLFCGIDFFGMPFLAGESVPGM
jgi:hypothetical protein